MMRRKDATGYAQTLAPGDAEEEEIADEQLRKALRRQQDRASASTRTQVRARIRFATSRAAACRCWTAVQGSMPAQGEGCGEAGTSWEAHHSRHHELDSGWTVAVNAP